MTHSSDGNLLSGHRRSLDGGYSATCNMVSLTPFLKEISGSKLAVRRGYESALAKILAIQHLNSGNGSLISEIEGLDERCPVKFDIDFVDTKLNIGVATTRLARRMINTDVPPCVFLGSTLSLVSATTSRFTASNGYPQISGSSTSSFLDDAEGYPLFSRTTPSTKGLSTALAQYLDQELGVNQLAVIYIADSYGFRYLADIKKATDELPNYFDLESVSLLPDLSNLSEAIEFVKATGFDHVFVAFYGEYFLDHSLMEEAIAQGAAGKHSNTKWFFGDKFLTPNDWIFDSSDPLVDAYKHASIFTADGRGSYMVPGGEYHEFAQQLKGLVEDTALDSNNDVIQKRSVTASKKKRKKTKRIRNDRVNMLKLYLETMVSDPVDKILAIEFLHELLEDDTFLHPAFLNHDIPYEYEAAIMAGLTICNSVEKDQIRNELLDTSQSLFIDGEGFQNNVIETTVRGISGDVMLDYETGTRLQNSTYYALQTFIPEAFVHDSSQIKFWKKTITKLELITNTDDEIDEHTMNTLPPSISPIPLPEIIHSLPPTMAPLPQQDPIFSLPPTLPPSLPSTLFDYPTANVVNENNFVRLIQSLACAFPIVASVGFIIWTTINRNQQIVRASKPLFLYLICCGVILFASATLPFATVVTKSFEGSLVEEYMPLMADLCSASIWLRTMGYTVIISALFAKTFRFNKIICGANQYHSSRFRVLVDYLLPLGIMLTTNILILSLMMVLNPITYDMIPNQSTSIDTIGIYEACIFTKEQRYKFLIPLVCWNVAVLGFSLHRSWSVRNFDLEASSRFPSESPQIFNALLSILMVSLIGIPTMLLVRDRGDNNTVALIEATVVFIFCILVLLTVFTTKIKHVWVTRKSRHDDQRDADGNRQLGKINNTYRESESDSEVLDDSNSPRLSTLIQTKDELKIENACLRKRNLELEGEILLYPTDGRRYDRRNKNTILNNFFGLSDTESHFKDENSTTTPSIVAMITEDTEQQQERPKRKSPPRPNFKKNFADIFFDSADVIPSYSEGIQPIIISQETTSWSLARELRSLRSTLKSSTNSSSNPKSSSKSNYYSSTIYRNSTATISNKSSPESKTTTNKSSPESKATTKKSSPESKSSKLTSKKNSPSTKSTPTPESDIRSGFFKSPGRLPESENPSSSPLDKTKGSYASSMAPLGGSPPTPIKTLDYSQSGPSKPTAIPQAGNEIQRNFDRGPGFLGITTIKATNTRSSFDSSTAPLGNLKSRSGLRSSFDSSMVPLGEPSVPGASTSISTGILESRSNAIFRPKRLSGGLDVTIPEDDDKNAGGIPIHIFIPSHQLGIENAGNNTDDFGEQILPETDFSAHQSLASANASLNVSLTTPPPLLPSMGRIFRRPSLGDDGGTPPRDPRNPYRHCV